MSMRIAFAPSFIQKGNAKYWMAATVRMSGANVLHDESVQNETHHIRTIT
jgi:hypothetical protein